MTQSDRIRQLLARGLTPREIANGLGVRTEFVRAVRNRDRNKVAHGCGDYPAERERRRERYRTEPEFRQRAHERARRCEARAKAARHAAREARP
jgi:hypothetical protein